MRPIYLLKAVMIGSVLVASVNANAQLSGGGVFMQGKYEEVGLTANGAYGAGSVPSGYHDKPAGQLGFVADPAMDGWAVGSPTYIGDYFTPGSPFEGWELQVGGSVCQAYCCGGFSGPLPGTGSVTGYATSGSTVYGTWQGMIDSIAVTQVTTVDTLGLYFTIKVTLTNTASVPKNDIYYLRTLDPDNDEAEGGPFSTNNIIDHQVADTTVVSAVSPGLAISYLALGTTDTPAVAFIYNAWGLSATVDLDTVFNQTYVPAQYTQGVPDNGDIAIGVVIKVAHLAPADSASDSLSRETAVEHKHPANSASFTYFYSFSPAATDSAIKAGNTPPPAITDTVPSSSLGIKSVNTTNVKVYPNPAKNVINITGLTAGDQVALYDMTGRKTDQNWTVSGASINTYSMNTVPAGSYIVVVNDANGNVKARVPVRKL